MKTIGYGVWVAIALLSVLPPIPRLSSPRPPLTQYRLVAQLDYEAARLTAQETVDFVNGTTDTLDRILLTTIPAPYFRVTDTRVDGKTVVAQQDGVNLELPLPTPLLPGQGTRLYLSFQLDIPHHPGRFGVAEDIISLTGWLPLVAVYRGPRLARDGLIQGWVRPPHTDIGDPYFSQIADFEVTITTSVPVIIAHSGELKSREGNSWTFSAPGVRDFGLAISHRYETKSQWVNGVEIVAYYLPEHAPGAEMYLESTQEMLQWLNRALEPYPYPRLSVAEMASQGLLVQGQEFPQLILIGSEVTQAGGGIESYLSYVIIHEVAHQWLYGLVGNDQIYQPWLDEAPVKWLSLDFYRANHPQLFPQAWQDRVTKPLDGVPQAYQLPVDSTILDFTDELLYFATVYNRGTLFIEELYQAMGGDNLWAMLREYIDLYRADIATPSAFLDLAQAHTPVNLNPIIARYLSYANYRYPQPLRPTVSWPTEPWSGVVTLEVAANAPLDRVTAFADDAEMAVSISPGEVTLDTAPLSDGEYLLTLVLGDTTGREAQAAHRVSVHNPMPPTPTATPPPVDLGEGGVAYWGIWVGGGILAGSIVVVLVYWRLRKGRDGLL